MLTQYHIEMCHEALANHFSQRALQVITKANINQDRLSAQFGHDEYHFDNNAIEKSNRYINEQRGYILATFLGTGISLDTAWSAFGRLLHSAQDFYAHSNYITLWLEYQPASPATVEIDPLNKSILQHPNFHTGKIYFPMDMVYFIKPLRPLALRFLPKDSHGWMNLDSPEQGFKFEYAIAAAVKRTQHEFELLQKLLNADMMARFLDK